MISLNSVINFLNDNVHKRISDYDKIPKFELKKDVDIAKLLSFVDEEPVQSVVVEQSLKSSEPVRTRSLPASFSVIFDTTEFYIDNKSSRMCKNKTSIFTFINSIFMIIYPEFVLLNEGQREEHIKSFLKKISDELFINNLYHKFGYPTNRRINKSDLQEILVKSFTFKYEEELVPLLQQYVADYFGINIFVMAYANSVIDFINSYYILASYFKIKHNPLVPIIVLVKDNDIYKSMLLNSDKTLITYSDNKGLVENLWKYFKLTDINECLEELKQIEINNEKNDLSEKIDMTKMKKLKVDELKEVCSKYDISLQKVSEKTGKMINKTKSELLEELEKILI